MLTVAEILKAVETDSYRVSKQAGSRSNLRSLVSRMEEGFLRVNFEINPSDFLQPYLVIEASIERATFGFVWGRDIGRVTLLQMFTIIPAVQVVECRGVAA